MDFTGIALILLTLLFASSSLLYKYSYTEHARKISLVGFGSLSILSTVATIVFMLNGIYHIWFFGANMGVILMSNAFTRVWTKEDISYKLTQAITGFLIVLVPLHTIATIRPFFKEFIARHLYFYVRLLGIDANLMYQEPGLLTRVVFVENNTFLYITWACVGYEFVALFAAIIFASDTTFKKKVIGTIISVLAIYTVNMARLLFTGIVLVHNLLGPLVTSENTIQMSYYLSESIISQIVALLATIGLFVVLIRYIPDVKNVMDGFLDLHPRIESRIEEKLSEYL